MHEGISRVDLSIERIAPRVLQTFLYTQGREMLKGERLPKRYVHDYELELFVYSEGGMFIDEVYHPIQSGDVVFRKPGQQTEAVMPYSCYLICFDPVGSSGKDPCNFDFCADAGVKGEFQDYYVNPILEGLPSVFHPDSPAPYQRLFDQVLNDFVHPTEVSSLVQKACVIQLLCLLYRDSSDPLKPDIRNSPYGNAVRKAVSHIRDNIRSPLPLKCLAELTGYSPSYFHRIFQEVMGVTPNEFITKARLDRAKELLLRSDEPVHRIAVECGIENIPYFSFLFKKHLGITPIEFRLRHSYHM